MSLPSLDLILETQYPVIVCARPWARDLLAAYSLLDFVDMSGHWRRDRAGVAASRRRNGLAGSHGLLLPDSLSSALVFRLAGVPSAGHRDDGRSLLLRWPVPKAGQSLHAVESWYRLTRAALAQWGLANTGKEEPPSTLGLKLTDTHRQAAATLMKQSGLSSADFILIAPTAVGLHRGRNKVWPHFDELTHRLQAQGHTVVMSPPPAEREQALRNAPGAHCLPSVGLGAFAALAKEAALVICNDSGVSHLAAAAGARQLTLFGVTEPARTGPWSDNASCLGSSTRWPSLADTVAQANRLLHSETER